MRKKKSRHARERAVRVARGAARRLALRTLVAAAQRSGGCGMTRNLAQSARSHCRPHTRATHLSARRSTRSTATNHATAALTHFTRIQIHLHWSPFLAPASCPASRRAHRRLLARLRLRSALIGLRARIIVSYRAPGGTRPPWLAHSARCAVARRPSRSARRPSRVRRPRARWRRAARARAWPASSSW